MSASVNFMCVALGGALGACLRYGLNLLLAGHLQKFPYATLSANLLGAFLAGVVTTWFWQKGVFNMPLQLILVVGFLGGFTTFSAFSVETLRLVEAGNLQLAGLNIMLNLVGSLAAVLIGAWLTRTLLLD